MITGVPVQNQSIALLNSDSDTEPIAVLDDDSKPLGFHGARDWQVLKVSRDIGFFTLYADYMLIGDGHKSVYVVYRTID